jgi:hypothetical protein
MYGLNRLRKNSVLYQSSTGVADPRRMKPSWGSVSGHDFSRAVEVQQRSGLSAPALFSLPAFRLPQASCHARFALGPLSPLSSRPSLDVQQNSGCPTLRVFCEGWDQQMSTQAFAFPTLCKERKGWSTQSFCCTSHEKLIWTGLEFRRPFGTLGAG